MSNMGDLVRNPNNAEDFLQFISSTGYGQSSTSSRNSFAARAYHLYGDMGDDTESECPSVDDELFTSTSSSNVKTTPNPVLETPPILPDVEMTPVDQTVTPETSRKKRRVLQMINKSRTNQQRQILMYKHQPA
ncbi:unnamed protein product [Rhizophagus irregularis]|nr:unnamed protein product [Rhizophagus irregularis]